jgi:branched-chain amino acid transport system substrate-binding protein
VEGWYATIASPHLTEDKRLADWVKRYKAKFGVPPEDYSITAYDGALIIIAAAKKLAASGKPVTREAIRDAIESDKVSTLQGDVSFDANGDLKNKVVSVFQIKKDDAKPLDEMDAQFKYIGVAPQS